MLVVVGLHVPAEAQVQDVSFPSTQISREIVATN